MITSTSIIGGEDFVELRMDMALNVGDTKKCVAIVIYEDQKTEVDELFLVRAEGLGSIVHTEVIILDDDGNLGYVVEIGKKPSSAHQFFPSCYNGGLILHI